MVWRRGESPPYSEIPLFHCHDGLAPLHFGSGPALEIATPNTQRRECSARNDDKRGICNDNNDKDKIARKSGKFRRTLDKIGRRDIYYLPIEKKVKVSEVPGSKRTVGIRQCSGGVYPRLSFGGVEAWAGTSPAPTNECSGEVYPRLVRLIVP